MLAGMQATVLAVTLALMAVVALVFLVAVGRAGAASAPADPEPRRRTLIWGLLIFCVIVSVASLRPWPHAVEAGALEVNATGSQWFWDIDVREVPVGRPVVFNVHAGDVNHGFGVADPAGRILFQAQAMPGYVNRVEYVFEEPGTYRVMCLEYCGLVHHDMNDELVVVAN